MNDLFHTEAWEKAWKDESDARLLEMKRNGVDPTRSFDPKARTFDEQSFSEEGRKRTRRIMDWLAGQGVRFDGSSILDIGAATGVFAVPFAERGARVTAIETSPPQIELLERNVAGFPTGQVKIVPEPFEAIDVQAVGWIQAFDLVFASMCPVIHNWESVEKVLSCARRFCYISMPASAAEHSLVHEVWPLVADQPYQTKHTDMGYLQHLLYLKGYAYEALITRETKTKELSREAALQEAMTWLGHRRLPADDRTRNIITDYLEHAYPSGNVVVHEGGRFGKVLIRLQDQRMYAREI